MTSSPQAADRNTQSWSNWSGSQKCQPRELLRPATEDELADTIRQTPGRLRVAGAGHSFSALVPTSETLISLERIAGIRGTTDDHRATCGAGTTIRDLGEPLYDRGLGLANQGDVDAQTLAGAFSTGTHGTGPEFGCLATDVVAFRLVTARGAVVSCDTNANSDIFYGGRVAIGALGILTEVTIQCRPAFSLRERLEAMNLDECLERSDQLASSNRHFEFFLFPYANRVLVKTTNLAAESGQQSSADQHEDRLFGWACQAARVFPVFNPALQRLIMRWYPGRERCDRAYRVFPSARTVRFNEMEYEVPAEAGVSCFREIVTVLRKQRLTDCFPLEFRRVKRDPLWLSPFFERDSVSISVHQHFQQPYEALFQLVEPVFWKYDGRPHWGKLHTLSAPRLEKLYPRWKEFCQLREQMDPDQKFVNPYLARVLGLSI
jgi:FAD-linked oxidoreductase